MKNAPIKYGSSQLRSVYKFLGNKECMMKRSLFLTVLALMLVSLSVSLVIAQDDIPRGGTVVINQENSAGWIRNFSPFAP